MSAIVALDPSFCPDCGAALARYQWGQPALFRHGGYGAIETTSRRWCPVCGWTLPADITTTNPRPPRPDPLTNQETPT